MVCSRRRCRAANKEEARNEGEAGAAAVALL